MNDGAPRQHWFEAVDVRIWLFLIGQLVAVIIWGVRIDSRVDALEDQNGKIMGRIEHIDSTGTRHLQLTEERLRILAERQTETRQAVETMMRIIHPSLRPQPP